VTGLKKCALSWQVLTDIQNDNVYYPDTERFISDNQASQARFGTLTASAWQCTCGDTTRVPHTFKYSPFQGPKSNSFENIVWLLRPITGQFIPTNHRSEYNDQWQTRRLPKTENKGSLTVLAWCASRRVESKCSTI